MNPSRSRNRRLEWVTSGEARRRASTASPIAIRSACSSPVMRHCLATAVFHGVCIAVPVVDDAAIALSNLNLKYRFISVPRPAGPWGLAPRARTAENGWAMAQKTTLDHAQRKRDHLR